MLARQHGAKLAEKPHRASAATAPQARRGATDGFATGP